MPWPVFYLAFTLKHTRKSSKAVILAHSLSNTWCICILGTPSGVSCPHSSSKVSYIAYWHSMPYHSLHPGRFARNSRFPLGVFHCSLPRGLERHNNGSFAGARSVCVYNQMSLGVSRGSDCDRQERPRDHGETGNFDPDTRLFGQKTVEHM